MRKVLLIGVLVMIAGVIAAATYRLYAAGDRDYQESLPPYIQT